MRLPAIAVQLQGFAHSTEKRLSEQVGWVGVINHMQEHAGL